jgi:hypothetical protein
VARDWRLRHDRSSCPHCFPQPKPAKS